MPDIHRLFRITSQLSYYDNYALYSGHTAWPMVWVCGRSIAGIAGLNPAGVIDVCLVTALCCQVHVSASGWSLVQRSPTDCDVCNWVSSWILAMRRWHTACLWSHWENPGPKVRGEISLLTRLFLVQLQLMLTTTFLFWFIARIHKKKSNLIMEIIAIIRTRLNPCCKQAHMKLLYKKNTNPSLLTE